MTKSKLHDLELIVGLMAVFCFIITICTMSIYIGIVGLILWVIRGEIAKAAIIHKGMPEHPNQFIMDYIEAEKSKKKMEKKNALICIYFIAAAMLLGYLLKLWYGLFQ